MTQIFNFSAGPAVLPKEVLQQAASEMLDWHGSGMSVMEMSHRGPEFISIYNQAEADLRELLAVRLQASKTSVSKYKRVLNGVSADGRLRGLLAFCGALRTGRWAGRLIQPQNLSRGTLSPEGVEHAIEELLNDAEDLL